MPILAPDPAPRSYPPFVTLVRRSSGGRDRVPREQTPAAVEHWLLEGAMAGDDLLTLFEELVWRLVAAGLPLVRASLHTGTLHPQLYGFAWNWDRADGLCDEVRVTEDALRTDAYRRNPLFLVIDRGQAFRGNPQETAMAARYPLLADLAGKGITDYAALPLRSGGAYHNAATLASDGPTGFGEEGFAVLQRLYRLFALHVERHIALRIAGQVLDTYLGGAAGGQVLRGTIRRGDGRAIQAVIWISDLRGFTDLVERLDGRQMILVLNAYFERLAGAVMAQGGEVLKFLGDGLLAVFPLDRFVDGDAAARAALAAARAALADTDRLNAQPPAELAAIDGWAPLRSGIALHEGELFFGNVGAPDRLDFTVIGAAANAASRVEGLCKTLGRPVLLTEAVARRLQVPLEHLGRHRLRGFQEPVALFSPLSAPAGSDLSGHPGDTGLSPKANQGGDAI